MYPPRSDKYKRRGQSKRRLRSLLLGLNLSMIVVIICLGIYMWPSLSMHRALDGNTDVTNQIVDKKDGNQGLEAPEPQPPENDPSTDPSIPDPNHEEETVPEEERLLIHFAGDTIFAGKVAEKLKKEGYAHPYHYVKELFQNDDLSILNLETPVTDRGQAAENKTFVFKSSPEALPEMSKAGVEAVSLANNHTLDQGVEGLLDTIDHLNQNGIYYAGAGKNSTDAYAPVYIERKGITIALCGFTRVIPDKNWAAGKYPGVAAAYDSRLAVKSVQTARENADLILVSVHWGKERATELEEHQTALAHEFIDAGADLVVGSHPHVLQGLEQYKGKWIAYSVGNFIFTKSLDPNTWETAVLAAECTKDGDCRLKLIPYMTELGQPIPMGEEEGVQLLKKVESLSPGVMIDSTGVIKSITEDNSGTTGRS